jgi:hypothetical protein
MKYDAATEKIIGAFYTVYNTLSYGSLEKPQVKRKIFDNERKRYSSRMHTD